MKAAALRELVEKRLEAGGVARTSWAGAVRAAFDGRDALERYFAGVESAGGAAGPVVEARRAEVYLRSLTVEGFRGIAAAQTLTLNAGPGLTVITGRNGSGKSSFAEALEVLFTGSSKRWENRTKVWKDGWRNLHHDGAPSIRAELLVSHVGSVTVRSEWDAADELEDARTTVQPHGQPKTTLDAMGWTEALVACRPFLSYNELGSMLDEGPSKLHDALSMVLGLEEAVAAQEVLRQARLDRQKAMRAVKDEANGLIDKLAALLERGTDERAAAALAALDARQWDLTRLEALVSGLTTPEDDSVIGVLQQAVVLEAPDADRVNAQVQHLRESGRAIASVASTDAERSRKLAGLLMAALAFHESHAGTDCPVCGTAGVLGPEWQASTRAEIDRLKARAKKSEDVHRQATAVRNETLALLRSPPQKLFAHLALQRVAGVDAAREAWTQWSAGAQLEDLAALADHLESRYNALANATRELQRAAAAELQQRQDRWRPLASAIAAWIPQAKKALQDEEELEFIEEAEKWLKHATAEIRDERFAPIADRAMAIWKLLRLNSNVELARIELSGSNTARRVALNVTVDGVDGAALGVMSQGELHSLALSLFLPRATLAESVFRFVVIDDPVQSMDPARVDGLARVLEAIARTRQVIVFTHDTRLSDAIRRLGIAASMLEVTRRPKSVVEVRKSRDPVDACIEDAFQLVWTADAPKDVVQRVVPGFCRSALEAACLRVIRRRRLGAGQAHDDVEREIEQAKSLTQLAALALFDDRERGGDVLTRLNRFGAWAGDVYRQCKEGAHAGVDTDLNRLINNAKDLCERILELK